MTARKKPKVYLTRKLPDAVETRMRELFDAELNIDDSPRTREQLAEALKTAEVLVPTVTDRIEHAVGRDLQFIRVNGTLVGGLVGVAIHLLNALL